MNYLEKKVRLSMVFRLKTDVHTARQIQNGIEAFVKKNYGVADEDIQIGLRTLNNTDEKN